jgi:hypothetical protein
MSSNEGIDRPNCAMLARLPQPLAHRRMRSAVEKAYTGPMDPPLSPRLKESCIADRLRYKVVLQDWRSFWTQCN